MSQSKRNSALKPPKIVHHGRRPQEWEGLIDEMADKIRMPSRQVRLLKYYASQGAGFRPALATIEKETGIPANKVSELRLGLVLNGVLAYGKKNPTVTIYWNRIKALASLPKPERKKDIRLYPPSWWEQHPEITRSQWTMEMRKLYDDYYLMEIEPDFTSFLFKAWNNEQKERDESEELTRVIYGEDAFEDCDSRPLTQEEYDIMFGNAVPLPF